MWELEVCQSDLGGGEGYGADHLECLPLARTGQAGDQDQSTWVWEGQVLLDSWDLLLGQERLWMFLTWT